MTLRGKVAWVTGGGRGIGRSIALHLASRGAAVVVSGRTERTLGAVVGEIAYQGGRAKHVVADVRDVGAQQRVVEACVETFGGLDVIVANAGISGLGALAGDPSIFEEALATNLLGAFLTFRAGEGRLRDGGRLIAISSFLAGSGAAHHAATCASKAGLEGLVRALAVELAPRRITVNSVSPGWTESDLSDGEITRMATLSGRAEAVVRAEVLSKLPGGSLAEPDGVARVVAFLSSAEADALTGQALGVFGLPAAAGH